MSHKRLTCFVPTHNRPQFLRRLLHFYARFPPDFSFLVADSSVPSIAAENLAVIDGVRSQMDISYQHYDRPFYDKLAAGLQHIGSPFVVLCADDDYLFPDAVSRCVEFLENEPGYASAMGRKVLLNTTLPRWRGKLKILKGYSIEHDRPLDRCCQMAAQWMSNFYAVYRTETLLDNSRIAAANSDSQSLPHLPETLLSQLSVLRGRAKVLPIMYSLWQRHGTNWTIAAEKGVQPQAELLYQQFKSCLADQFDRAGIDRADSENFVDYWYGDFRYPDLARRRRRCSTVERIHRVLHGIAERAVDYVWTDRARHCRSVRASDRAGCEPAWRAAVQLMCDFPQGIPSDHSTLERGA